jgi:predicted RNA binding protein YcfA (HicA-like mRNA interferase family)
MKSMSGKELAKLLESDGWILRRINGSHHIYGEEGEDARISVPIHRNQDLKIGLLRKILKTAGMIDSSSSEAIDNPNLDDIPSEKTDE